MCTAVRGAMPQIVLPSWKVGFFYQKISSAVSTYHTDIINDGVTVRVGKKKKQQLAKNRQLFHLVVGSNAKFFCALYDISCGSRVIRKTCSPAKVC